MENKHFFMRKVTMSMAIFNSELLVYQGVSHGFTSYKTHGFPKTWETLFGTALTWPVAPASRANASGILRLSRGRYIYIYIYIYVCMYIYIYICMYVCIMEIKP